MVRVTSTDAGGFVRAIADAYEQVLAGRPYDEIVRVLAAAVPKGSDTPVKVVDTRAQVLATHLDRLSVLCEAQARRRRNVEVWLDLLDRLPFALLIVDGHGRVRVANRRAHALVTRQGHVRIADGRLRGARQSDDVRVRRLFDDTASNEDEHFPLRVLRLESAASSPIWLAAWRLGGRNPAGLSDLTVVLATEATSAEPSPDVLREAFGLTPAEARVAALIAAGKRPAEVATTLHVSQNAVRFHLKNVFGKLGVTRQTDLVRVVMASPACVLERS